MSSIIMIGCDRLSSLKYENCWVRHEDTKNVVKKLNISRFEKIHLDPVPSKPSLTLTRLVYLEVYLWQWTIGERCSHGVSLPERKLVMSIGWAGTIVMRVSA